MELIECHLWTHSISLTSYMPRTAISQLLTTCNSLDLIFIFWFWFSLSNDFIIINNFQFKNKSLSSGSSCASGDLVVLLLRMWLVRLTDILASCDLTQTRCWTKFRIISCIGIFCKSGELESSDFRYLIVKLNT